MTWPVGGSHVVVGARTSILISHQHADGRANSAALEYPAEDFYAVSFLSLRHQPALTRTTPVELDLNVVIGELQTRGTTVDDHSDAPTMRFAECSDAELFSKGVPGHTTESRGREPQLTKRFSN